jgi:osmotically inducible protein OsmC
MAAVRTATVTWNGDLASGTGTVTAGTSGRFTDLPISWGSRTEAAEGRTSPEELLAAAHASCFAMALSHELSQSGHPPEKLSVGASCTIEPVEGGFGITRSELKVRGAVPGIDADAFQTAAQAAGEGCPVSGALRGNVEISVDAELET